MQNKLILQNVTNRNANYNVPYFNKLHYMRYFATLPKVTKLIATLCSVTRDVTDVVLFTVAPNNVVEVGRKNVIGAKRGVLTVLTETR